MSAKLTFGELFAGIGGIGLGLERAGMECKWQAEIEPYACRVLAHRWPFHNHGDVSRIDWCGIARVALLAGGFPCQDVSNAGLKQGVEYGQESGLWREFARAIRGLRPRWVLVENVEALRYRGRGMDRVLAELAALGYDAQWSTLSSCALGGAHTRSRMFIVAYSDEDGCYGPRISQEQWEGLFSATGEDRDAGDWALSRAYYAENQSGILRVVDEVPDRMDRIAALGNAVDPVVAQWVGERIVAAVTSLVA